MSSVDQPGSRGLRHFVPEPHEFSDDEAAYLLRAIYCYVLFYDHSDDSISSLASELAQSLDRTTDAEDQMRREVEEHFLPTMGAV